MSLVLASRLKSKVIFDPTNDEHRKWVFEYIKTRSWKNCPVSFMVDDNSMSVAAVIERQLVEFYSKREFGEL